MRTLDVLIVGGGPAGLATGLALQDRGWSILACDQRLLPADKCCGEGLMPTGLADLEALGVDMSWAPRFTGISYHSPAGRHRQADFREGPGVAVRRPELSRAMLEKVRFEVRPGVKVQLLERGPAGILAQVGGERVLARLVVGADGLGSGVRRWAGLEGPKGRRRRWGARRHYRVSPWSTRVEVYWSRGGEAYVSPCGPDLVGIALLWDEPLEVPPERLWEGLLEPFSELRSRLEGEPVTPLAVVGPFHRRAMAQVAPGLVLVGDAAGYLDAITGEGLSLAFAQARALGKLLPQRLTGLCPPLWAYQRAYRRMALPYYLMTGLALELSRRPRLLEWAMRWVSDGLFQRLLSANMGRF